MLYHEQLIMNHLRSKRSSRRSRRLITTTPSTCFGAAMTKISSINPKFKDGLPIMKVSSKGNIVPRIFTISDDLFTLFISHDKMNAREESFKDRVQYRGYKVYSKMIETVVGHSVQASRDMKVIDVADIVFVVSGYVGSQKLEACRDHYDAKQVVSIFHKNMENIDFLVVSDEDRMSLLTDIHTVRKVYHESKLRVSREELLLRYSWYDIDWDKSGMIREPEFLQLLVRINIYMKQDVAHKLFNDYIKRNTSEEVEGIDFNECLDILRFIKHEHFNGSEMSDQIFYRCFGIDVDEVTAQEFLTKFLHQSQNEFEATLCGVEQIFANLNNTLRSSDDAQGGGIGSRDDSSAINRVLFDEYLTGYRNDIFSPEKKEFDPSTLNEPISHYWINTSHNTYLTGDQLRSTSSVEMYVLALQRGCKCLELDCWDDPTSSLSHNPVVYHGYTLTSKIPFQSVISAVRFYIDTNPDTLPIILSLENHCTPPFQKTMADVLRNTLNYVLYVPDNREILPSPMELVGRVVIKGKHPPDIDDDDDGDSTHGTESRSTDECEIQALATSESALAGLTYFNGVSFHGFSTSVELPSTDMYSFSEGKIGRLTKCRDSISSWREYNKDHMSRTYPSGTRVDSSNYKPLIAWAMGCQFVALNFQTCDSSMLLNDGRFRENGGCGYVLKPLSLLSMEGEPSVQSHVLLNMRVLSGSLLPKPYGEKIGEVIDPYVIIRLHDIDLDTVSLHETTEWKTKTVRDNGFCPQWNSDICSFKVKTPDVAIVEFNVSDSDGGFLENTMLQVAIPVICLRQGARSVFFQNISKVGSFDFASILVEVDMKLLHT